MKYITAFLGALLIFIFVLFLIGVVWGAFMDLDSSKSVVRIEINQVTVIISALAATSSFYGTLRHYKNKEKSKGQE